MKLTLALLPALAYLAVWCFKVHSARRSRLRSMKDRALQNVVRATTASCQL
jgi:hypothetical protein